jgi:hypothetical protein
VNYIPIKWLLKNEQIWAGGVGQAVDHLPHKHKALSLIPSPRKKKKKKTEVKK